MINNILNKEDYTAIPGSLVSMKGIRRKRIPYPYNRPERRCLGCISWIYPD
jgi:hypothetical protein